MKISSLAILLSFGAWVSADLLPGCDVAVGIESGTVCGKKRSASNGDLYASFRGMRYAKAPVAELRFAEPQKPAPHDGIFDASEAGPICPQIDVIYGRIMEPRSMDEDCLRINVHTPLNSLPTVSGTDEPLLPVLVFVHGGSFSYGSGDADLQGPEYLMAGKGVILVTFNYRLNVFGFLSLYSNDIPGNAGLRDAHFALKWVQNNIKNFGGDPNQVTLAGQSAGGVIAHTLSLSPALQGQNLFQRVIGFSGISTSGFYSYSASYTKFVNSIYLLAAGINILHTPKKIHEELIKAPVERLLKANKVVLDITGLVSFTPVIEEPTPGFTTILPKEPETLINEGYGKEYTTWLSFTNNEAECFRQRLDEINIVNTFRLVPALTVPFNIVWSSKLLAVPVLTAMMMREYFNSTLITMDKFLPAGTDGYYKYPAMRLAEHRLSIGSEPTYISQFSYHGSRDIFKLVQGRDWPGSGHVEDITYFFRVNSILGPLEVDELAQDTNDSIMKLRMTEFVANFVKTGSPAQLNESSNWPPTGRDLSFNNIDITQQFEIVPPTDYMRDKKTFFDKLNKIGRGI